MRRKPRDYAVFVIDSVPRIRQALASYFFEEVWPRTQRRHRAKIFKISSIKLAIAKIQEGLNPGAVIFSSSFPEAEKEQLLAYLNQAFIPSPLMTIPAEHLLPLSANAAPAA